MNIISYFTKQNDVKSIILDHLDKAKTQVNVAVAWFTERALFDKLLEIQERGVHIEVVITNHEFNHKCANDYTLIEEGGGFFAEIGSDEQLMHMKFCVIDFETVISGSANWSNRAFTENNEEVTIVTGNFQRAHDFIDEFERLKQLSGKLQALKKDVDISKAIKTLEVIRSLINLGEANSIQPYIHKIKHVSEIKLIIDLLLASEFEAAMNAFEAFKKRYTQLIAVSEIEKAQLLSQINLIAYQIEALETEKVEIEASVEQFNHRYIIELNPLIAKILALKKKIYEKLKKYGIDDDTYEKVNEEFHQKNKEYQEAKEHEIPELNEEEKTSLKQMYREAASLCHPDSAQCIYEDKAKANEVFSNLANAYKANNVEEVKYLWGELKNGNPISGQDQFDEIEHLRRRLETLKMKFNLMVNDLFEIKSSEAFQIIENLTDWDAYFELQKELLKQEHQELTEKYVNHEQPTAKE